MQIFFNDKSLGITDAAFWEPISRIVASQQSPGTEKT